ncbi:cytochrome P450 2C29-like [Pyxicephalus adspersus]|uniref:cytochrome P450 2C29-like n=1 Tax=Pyxicephalus adspersus TaxID=30357 RepID=UPI003B5A560D
MAELVCLIFSNGNTWKVMRRFTLSTLRDFGMGKRTIEDRILEECKNLVKSFKAHKGEPFEKTTIIFAAVANIIVSIVMGHRFEYNDPKLHRLMSIVTENIKIIGSPMVFLYNAFPSLVRWLPGSHRKVIPHKEELHTFIRETFTNQKEQLDVNDQRTFTDVFLMKQKEEKPNPEIYFSDENLTSLITDLFAAGMDTTSATLRWAPLLMMKYPEIQNKERFEKPDEFYPQHFLDTEGNFVKNEAFLPFSADKEHFEKPDEFYPQHFLDTEGNFVKNEAFLPFSAGKRGCAGETLAKMELFLFFTTLLQNFTFQAPPGAKLDITGAVGFTTPPLKHEICAIPRKVK